MKIPPVKHLKPINLTDFGEIELIDIEAYCSGAIDQHVITLKTSQLQLIFFFTSLQNNRRKLQKIYFSNPFAGQLIIG